ncbi:MAG: FAD-binding protein [Methyloprofundus sp.]|nr:FAD-binding protein [Methyloprofundus sp.]MDT8426826.1 FAD-binding protein [Methyloprofundus sp.]
MNILVLAEHDGQQLKSASLQAITAAQFWQAPVHVLLLGHALDTIAAKVAAVSGVTKVIKAEAAHLEKPLAEDIAALLVSIGSEYKVILAAHSSFSRNSLPRAAALLDVAMISDVLEIQAENCYVRSIYAGNILTHIQSQDEIQVLTVHSSHFVAADNQGGNAEISTIDVPAPFTQTRWLSAKYTESDRPALSSAKVVVSGGRSLGSAENFEQVLAPLAAKLGAALGATRAAVDAGYAANELQVGQTGVVVAPELYIAVGISGAVQHTYGMKDSRIVVAINQDPDAPIFQIADYGLVADLFDTIPAITAAIQ